MPFLLFWGPKECDSAKKSRPKAETGYYPKLASVEGNPWKGGTHHARRLRAEKKSPSPKVQLHATSLNSITSLNTSEYLFLIFRTASLRIIIYRTVALALLRVR